VDAPSPRFTRRASFSEFLLTNFREGIGMIVIPARVKVVVVMVCALALAAGLLTLTLLAKPAQAEAQTFRDSFRGPLTRLVTNPCTKEEVLLEGSENLLLYTTTDANGGVHFLVRGNAELQGESASGVKYVAHQTINRIVNDSISSETATTITLTNNLQVIRQGSATPTPDDFVLQQVIHLTVNANGEITSVVNEFNEEECI
jgi:hypothetical protein